jgi:hypothetical protein
MKRFLKSTADKMIDGVTRVADYIAATDETIKTRKGAPVPLQIALALSTAIASPIAAYHLTDIVVESTLGADDTPLLPDPKREAFNTAAQKVATLNYYYNLTNINADSTLTDIRDKAAHEAKVDALARSLKTQFTTDYRLSDKDVVILQQRIPSAIKDSPAMYYNPDRAWITTNYAIKKDREACLIKQFKSSTSEDTIDARGCIYENNVDLDSAELIFPVGTILGGIALFSLTVNGVNRGADVYRRRLKAKQTLN